MLDREVDILKRIQHKHIIAVVEIYETDKHLYLVMELWVHFFCDFETLRLMTS